MLDLSSVKLHDLKRFVWCLAPLIGLLPLTASADEPAPSIIPADGFNLRIQTATPDKLVVAHNVKGMAHNWFAGRFQNLPVSKPMTISVSMTGNNTSVNQANVSKWQGLYPVMTYGDPTQYDSYNWFLKDISGRWISSDPFLKEDATFGENRPLPQQDVIPDSVAAQFLSPDGKMWFPWREIPTAQADIKSNTFHIQHQFEASAATVAMRVPFTYTYLQQVLSRLQAAQLPGVFVDTLGSTPEGRKLQIIRLEDPSSKIPVEQRPTLCVIAREHSTEHDTSWPVYGMLRELISNTPQSQRLRTDTTWLLLPLQDPDGAARSEFERMTEAFRKASIKTFPPERFDYALYFTNYVNSGRSIDVVVSLHNVLYFTNYVNSGRSIDVVVSLHNVECNEGENIFCPFIHHAYVEPTLNFNKAFFSALRKAGFATGRENTDRRGALAWRLFGWMEYQFGTMGLVYEVNSRYPRKRLSLPQLQQLGGIFARELSVWMQTKEGQERHRQAQEAAQQHRKEQQEYFAEQGLADTLDRAAYDLLERAFYSHENNAPEEIRKRRQE